MRLPGSVIVPRSTVYRAQCTNRVSIEQSGVDHPHTFSAELAMSEHSARRNSLDS
jgi:hypothetical protein